MTEATTEAPAGSPVESPAATEPAQQSLRDEASNIQAPTEFKVPDSFADRKWAANIKSEEDLYNQFDNLQGMIGKKSIPAADAPPEQLEEFYAQLRPETPEAYELKLPEGLEASIDDGVALEYKEFFYENGFTQAQAQALHDFHLSKEMARMPDPAVVDAEFDKTMEFKYGAGAKDAIKIAHKYLATASEETQAAFRNLPNDQLIAVIDVLNDNHKKFTREDTAPVPGGEVQTTSLEDKVREANVLRRSLTDPSSPDYNAKKAELQKMDDEIKRLHK